MSDTGWVERLTGPMLLEQDTGTKNRVSPARQGMRTASIPGELRIPHGRFFHLERSARMIGSGFRVALSIQSRRGAGDVSSAAGGNFGRKISPSENCEA